MKTFNTSILFIVFNRLHTMQKVFEAISQIKPPKLYVASDGFRQNRIGEDIKVNEVRKFIKNNINWDCELKTLYQETNLGCKQGVTSAINWFFDHENEGIILEDDCLPNKSFFPFCEILLEKYRDDERISSISGSQPYADGINIDYSYFFSKYNRIWGWATWKRAWKGYDNSISYWPLIKTQKKHRAFFNNYIEYKYWEQIWNMCYKGEIDTWDYQYFLHRLVNNQLTAVSTKKLVSNIGFGIEATHTTKSKHDIKYNKLSQQEISLNIIHPEYICANYKKDKFISTNYYNSKTYLKIIINRLKKRIINKNITKFILNKYKLLQEGQEG